MWALDTFGAGSQTESNWPPLMDDLAARFQAAGRMAVVEVAQPTLDFDTTFARGLVVDGNT